MADADTFAVPQQTTSDSSAVRLDALNIFYVLDGKSARDSAGDSSSVSSATESNELASSDADNDSEARAPPVNQTVTTTIENASSNGLLGVSSLSVAYAAENNEFTLSNDALPGIEPAEDGLPRGPPVTGDIDYLNSTGTPVTAVTDSLLDAPIADVTAIYLEAIARWTASGLIPVGADLALLDASPTIVDLGGDALASISGTTITIDINADEFGWYIDLDPSTDSELADTTFTGVDLLTVVMHEIGHYLGYEHGAAGLTGLMAATLAAEERFQPAFDSTMTLNQVIDALLHINFDPAAPPGSLATFAFTTANPAVPDSVLVGQSGDFVDVELKDVTLTFSLMTYDGTASQWGGQVSVESPVAVFMPGTLDTIILDDQFETALSIESAGAVTDNSDGTFSVDLVVDGDQRDGADILTAAGYTIPGTLLSPFTNGLSAGDEVGVLDANSTGFNDFDLADDVRQILVNSVAYNPTTDKTTVTVTYNYDPQTDGVWSGGGVIADTDLDTDDDGDFNAVGGTIFLGAASGIDLLRFNTLEATDLGFPIWLDVRITQMEMQFVDFRADDTNSTLRLNAQFLGINTGNEITNNLMRSGVLGVGFSVEGSVIGLEMDMSALRDIRRLASGELLIPRLPIVDLSGITAAVAGNLAGLGSFEANLIVKTVKIDSSGAITTVDAPDNREITYGAIGGSINVAGVLDLGLNFAVSELGPLQLFISQGELGAPGVDGIPIGTTGLLLDEIRGGIRFNADIEGLQVRPPFGATAGTVVFDSGADVGSQYEVTLTVPDHNLLVGDEFRITAAGNPLYLSGAENFVVTGVDGDTISYRVGTNPGAFSTTTDIKKISISQPEDLRDPGFLSTKDLSLSDWEAQLDQQVVNQANGLTVTGGVLLAGNVVDGHGIIASKVDINDDGIINDNDDGVLLGFTVINGAIDVSGNGSVGSEDDGVLPPASFWDVLFDKVIIEAGATVNIAGVPSSLLSFEVDIFIDSTGKILMTGVALLLNPESGFERGSFGINIPARLYVDLGQEGEASILFLMDVPEVPANTLGLKPLVVFKGKVTFETLINGVPATTDILTGFPNGVGSSVTAATVTDLSATGGGPWEITYTLDSSASVADEFAVGDTIIALGSDPSAHDGKYIVTGVNTTDNTVTFVIGKSIINGRIDVDGDGNVVSDDGDVGSLAGIPVFEGGLDIDRNGVIDTNDDGEILNTISNAVGELVVVPYRVIDGYIDVDGDGNVAMDVDDVVVIGADPGAWTGGTVVANEGDLGNGVRISIAGGVELNIPDTTTLSLTGSATLDISIPGPTADEDIRLDFDFDMSLSETNVGTIGQANGDFSVTIDTDSTVNVGGIEFPTVEVWGAALLTTDFAFLERYGLFADVSGALVFNNTSEDKAPIDLINTAGDTVSVTPTAETFALRVDGTVGLRVDFNDDNVFDRESEQLFLLEGAFVLSFVGDEGFDVLVFTEPTDPTADLLPATLEIGPTTTDPTTGERSDPYLSFNVFGFLAIRSNGVAANMILSLNASAPGIFASVASIDAQFVLMLNTTGTDVSFNIPAGASDPGGSSGRTVNLPRAPPSSIFDANLDISALINGNSWTLDSTDIGAPYILIHAGGTNPAVNPNASLNLGPFGLQGQFSFLLGAEVDSVTRTVSPLLEVIGNFALDVSIGSLEFVKLEGSGVLRYDSAGLVAAINFDQRAGTSIPSSSLGFELSTSFQLQVNTTASPFDPDGSADTDNSIDPGFRLHMAGMLDIAGLFVLEGTFDLTITSSIVELQITAGFDLLGVSAELDATAILTDRGFSLTADLTLATGGGLAVVPGLFNIEGTFRLTLNTITGSASIGIADANVNVLGLVLSGSIIIGVDSGQFYINVPDADPLRLDFFGVADLEVSGSFNFDDVNGGASGDNAFDFTASAGLDIGVEGLLGVKGDITVSFDSSGTFTGTVSGSAWILGISFDAAATLSISGSSISLKLKVSVTITPAFTIWNPFGDNIRVPALRATYRHTFNIGSLTPTGTFEVPDPDPLILGRVDNGTLYLHMGADAALRDPNNDWDDTEVDDAGNPNGDESFRVTHLAGGVTGPETVRVDAFGQQYDFSGVERIVVTDAGNGTDVIDIGAGVLADAIINGGNGADQISYLGGGRAILTGGEGNDQLVGGSGGTLSLPDMLNGGNGDDRLIGGTGVSEVLGGGGNDTIVWNQLNGAVLSSIDGGVDTGTAFRDTLQVFMSGASESVTVSAATSGGFDVSIGAAVSSASNVEGLILEMMGGGDTVTISDVTATPLERVIVRLGEGDGQQDRVILNGSTGGESFVLNSTNSEPSGSIDTIGVVITPNGGSVTDRRFIAIEQGNAQGGNPVTGDRLTINGIAGNDSIDASAVAAQLLNMDFIIGNDGGSIEGSQLADQINVTITGDTTGVLSLDGNGGGDAYTINLLGGDTDTEITINDTGGSGTDTVVVNGTPGAEQIRLTNIEFRQGSNSETLNYSGLESFTINTVGDADEVTIFSTHAGSTTVNTGDGADVVAIQSVAGTTTITTGEAIDRVNVGSNATIITNTLGTLDLIDALLTINTGTQADILDLDDSGDGVANTDGQLTGVDLNGLGTSNGIDYSNAEDLRLHLGLGADEFLINSTHSGLTAIDDSGGADIVSVRTIGGATNINTGAATDRVNVGSNASASGNTGGTVNGISAQLTVNGGSTGTDVLDVDDRADALLNTDGRLTNADLTGLGMSDGINYSDIEGLQIHLGLGSNEFLIDSTHAGLTSVDDSGGADTISVRTIGGATTINTGAATDRINVGSNASASSNTGGTVNGISAQLTVDGGSTGTDVLDVDDRGDALPNTDGQLTSTDLSGLGMSDGINYSAIEDLRAHLGSASDEFLINSTHAGLTTLNGNNGADIFNVRAAEGTVNINGDGGDDIVNVSGDSPSLPSTDEDAADVGGTVDGINGLLVVSGGAGTNDILNVDNSDPATIGQDGTLTSIALRGLSMPMGIDYDSLETLNIWLDAGANRFDIDATHTAITNVYARNGADEFNVRATAAGSLTNLYGQAGADVINISDRSPMLPADYPVSLPPPAADTEGNIDNVNGLVVIDGGLDDDTINVDDSANGADKEATLTDVTLRGLSLEGGVNYEDAEDLNIWLGTGTDTFYIASTHEGTTQLYAGDGNSGDARDDTIAINTISGVTTIHGQGGNDGILVNVGLGGGGDLPTLVGTDAANDAQFERTDGNGLDANGLQTAGTGGLLLNLHGEGGSDDYTLNLSGTGDALINVHDNGAGSDGDDTLTINGADDTATEDDTFLLRKEFVALLNTSNGDGGFEQIERVNYDENINAQLIVNGLGGEDTFAADDNSSLTTIDGGADNDSFQIGQIFATLRTVVAANIADGADEFDTTRVIIGIISDAAGNVVFDPSTDELNTAKIAEIEALIAADGSLPGIAYVSDGVSYDTVVVGGDGDDDFSVYQNKGTLRLEGEAGNDNFIVRAFVLLPEAGTIAEEQAETEVLGGDDDDSIQYAINAPVKIDGGAGFDTVVVLGTPFPDAFVVTDEGIFGAGLNVAFENVESAELDSLEGDDTIYVLATNPDLVTRIIAGQGDDTVNVMGDVVLDIVSNGADDYPPQDQNLGQIQGPLIILGGVLEGADRTFVTAIMLPDETDGDIFQENNSDQTGDIDVLNIFHTDNDAIQFGFLGVPENPQNGVDASWTWLTGFGMNSISDTLQVNEGTASDPELVDYDRGVTFDGFEIFEVLLGQGDETLDISDTPDDAITVIHGGGGSDTINITDRGQGPLVVYGDTSEDRSRYSNTDTDAPSHDGTAFSNDGDDTIDASGMSEQGDDFVGVVIYGGFGIDTIDGSDDDDHIAGGTGNDTIRANGGNDHIYGDSHFNVNPMLFAQDRLTPFDDDADEVANMFVVSDRTEGDDLDPDVIEQAGMDNIEGGVGADIIFGDHGTIDQLLGTRRIETTANVQTVFTTLPTIGAADTIFGGVQGVLAGTDDGDVIFGGLAGDTIRSGGGADIVLGDHGMLSYGLETPLVDLTTLDRIESTDLRIGDADIIFGDAGDDVLIGGVGNDLLDGGADSDLIFGDAVTLEHRPGDISSERFQTLLGQMLYGRTELPAVLQGDDLPASGNDSGQVLVDRTARDYRIPDRAAPDWAEYEITNLYHSADIEAGRVAELVDSFGDDYIAGGAGHDMIFGQLGDDVIQGDGSIDSAVELAPVRVDAERVPNGETTQLSPSETLEPVDAYVLSITSSFDAASDGDDYIEGNGGSDVIFGNLGQDDIVGGSSDMFSLITRDLRPDVDDILFGGSGTEIDHDELFDNETDDIDMIIPAVDVHARDADVIAGDNANIYRIVGTGSGDTGGFLSFDYDEARGGSELIRVRAVELLDYTEGGQDFDAISAATDIGAPDEIHGESGDDSIYGMAGNDVLFGDSESDDIIGGYGADWISGGQGMDGVIGDDGRIYTGRYVVTSQDPNQASGYAELLNGVLGVDQLDKLISTPGNIQQAIINPSENGAGILGEIFKTVDITPFNLDPDPFMQDQEYAPEFANDIIFGGLGNDFLHGAAGDDAMSGAEALPVYFNSPYNPGDVLEFDSDRIEFAAYDEEFPRRVLQNFVLNFNPSGDPNPAETANDNFDEDVLFGDLGNDWLVGGPDNDQMFGGYGADLMDADDDKFTNAGNNDMPDPINIDIQDRAFGGAGRDVLIANTGGDRLMDWVGEFNSFIVPFAPFGNFTVSRAPTPHTFTFLYELSESLGADQSRAVDSGNLTNPERNGEPDGELGLVTQKDSQWQDQSGAPIDPQPGNIPGGPRLTLRGVDFNSGTTETFAVDQGEFNVVQGRLEVSPTNLGETAAAVFHVGEYLPHYYEITATISTGKPTGGLKANSYIIFDYVSATDFKYAGINISTNKLEMGYVDESGWHELVQVNAKLRHSKDYDVLLAINGLTATLIVDNKDVLSFSYDARVDDDGFTYGLNYGLVGLGGINSIARIDNMIVSMLAPEITFEATETFDSGAAGFTPWNGDWQIASGAYRGTSLLPDTEAVSLFDLNVDPNSYLELEVTVDADTLGGVVFDHYADGTYKFAGVLPDTSQIVIGHVGKSGNVVYDAIGDITFNTPSNSEYSLRISLKGSTVSVAVLGGNGANATWYEVVGHAFNAVTVDGKAGVLSIAGESSIDTFVIRTDDPAFISEGDELLAPSLSLETDVPTLDVAAIQPLLDEAIRRMTGSFALDSEQQAALAAAEVTVADLPGLVLARNNGTQIEIDRDAAGHGWFVDNTPAEDSEFDANGRALTGSGAEGDIDLMTALMHELGHVLDFEHGDSTLMTDSITTGERIVAVTAYTASSSTGEYSFERDGRGFLKGLLSPHWSERLMDSGDRKSAHTMGVRSAESVIERRLPERGYLSKIYHDWW